MAISGGTYVIIQHASYLSECGYNVTLAVQQPFSADTLEWHDKASILRCIPFEDGKLEQFDLVIATWWETALELHNFNASRFAYFVQSIESRFYPAGEVRLRALVDATYKLPCAYVTEANWIRDHLATGYGHEVALVPNGIRKDIYRTTGKSIAPRDSNRQPRVLVEGPFGVSFKNTALGLRLAREAGAKDIWVLTGTPVKWIPGVSRVFSRVPIHATPEIYRSCDILVKLSTVEGMFGPPLEIFHCGGTAIVSDVTGHDEYIVDDQNARVIQRGDMDGFVKTLRHLLNNRTDLMRLQGGAQKTAEAWMSWDESSTAFLDWVESALAKPTVDREVIAEMNDKAFSDYVLDEQERLANAPKILRHRLSVMAAHLPQPLVRYLKQLGAAKEVLFGQRKVY